MAQESTSRSVESITQEVFDHLVELAAFALDAEEAAYLRGELNDQMEAIRELEAIDLGEDIEITSHGIPYPPSMQLPLRQDRIQAKADADEILAQAPEVVDRYIVVPDIPHEALE